MALIEANKLNVSAAKSDREAEREKDRETEREKEGEKEQDKEREEGEKEGEGQEEGEEHATPDSENKGETESDKKILYHVHISYCDKNHNRGRIMRLKIAGEICTYILYSL